MPKVSIFRNFNEWAEDKPIKNILEDIRSGVVKREIEDLRDIYLKGEKDVYTRKKKSLLSFTPGGTFKGGRRGENFEFYSQLVILDIDNLTIDQRERIKEQVINIPSTYAVFISPSNHGLKCLIKINTDEDMHSLAFKSVKDFFEKKLSIEIDPSGKDITRLCFYSYDPDLYLNEDAIIFQVGETIDESKYFAGKTKNEEGTIKAVETVIEMIEQRELDITKGYMNWLNLGFALTHQLGEAGRSYYQRISQFHPGFSPEDCDTQYTRCLKSTNSGITIGTFFHIAQTHGVTLKLKGNTWGSKVKIKKKNKFWYMDKSDRLKIDPALFYTFLTYNGFGKYRPKNQDAAENPIFIKVVGKIIEQTTKAEIIEYVYRWIEKLPHKRTFINKIKNGVHYRSILFSDNNLSSLQTLDLDFQKDSKEQAFLYFQNRYCEITGESIIWHDFAELEGYIWRSQIIKHKIEFSSEDEVDHNCEFKEFICNVCKDRDSDKGKARFISLISIIGYLLHEYKNPASSYAIIFMDEQVGPDPNGGTGKGICIRGIKNLKKTAIEDGKNFSYGSNFTFSQVDLDTKILIFEDVPKKFGFEKLFSMITEGINVEKKYKDKQHIPFQDSPKTLITTNYAVEGSGFSHERRRIEFEFSSYFNQTNTPEEKFGHLLFDDWSDYQWNLFYSFMIFCIQAFLKNGLIRPPEINASFNKLIQETSEEFGAFINDTIQLDTEYDKKDIYQQFTSEFQDFDTLKQNTFTRWLGKYANAYHYEMICSKSGNKYLFVFRTSEKSVKKPINPTDINTLDK